MAGRHEGLLNGSCRKILLLACCGLVSACAGGPPRTSVANDVPVTARPFADRPDNFQFAIVGDRTGGHRPGVFRHAIQRINQLQPEFVVGVGDLIEGYKEEPGELAREWDEFDAIVDALEMPFFYTVGNHDTGNEVSRDLWGQRYGRDYYHFLYRGVLFLSLNTEDPPVILSAETLARQAWLEETMREDPEQVRRLLRARSEKSGSGGAPPKLPGQVAISDAQVDWIERVLRENTEVRWTILLMHKPAWAYDSAAFARIEALLEDRPYTVIAGHEHYFNYTRRRDRDYVTMATTGGIWLTEGGGSFDHIAWVTMTDRGPLITNIALCGLLGTPRETAQAMASEGTGHCFRPTQGE
jgi:hypothetical protein